MYTPLDRRQKAANVISEFDRKTGSNIFFAKTIGITTKRFFIQCFGLINFRRIFKKGPPVSLGDDIL
jgi:hypothetical protein